MVDGFWASHYSYAEVAKKLGCTRQNVYQRCLRGSLPLDRDQDGNPGVPMDYIDSIVNIPVEVTDETE